jgi:hypothetical protein
MSSSGVRHLAAVVQAAQKATRPEVLEGLGHKRHASDEFYEAVDKAALNAMAGTDLDERSQRLVIQCAEALAHKAFHRAANDLAPSEVSDEDLPSILLSAAIGADARVKAVERGLDEKLDWRERRAIVDNAAVELALAVVAQRGLSPRELRLVIHSAEQASA